VAEDAGVSNATVSLILRNRRGWVEQFLPETVQRVRASAKRLGYRRNLFASGLPSGESRFFALVLRQADPNGSEWNSWAFQGALLEGVSAAAESQGIYAIVTTEQGRTDGPDTGRVSGIIEGGVFGTIFQSPSAQTEKLIRAQLDRKSPLVAVLPERPASWPTNAIDRDNLAAGRTAGGLLVAGSKQRWALVCPQLMNETQRLRCDGLIQVARESGASLSNICLPQNMDENTATEILARRLGRRDIDAIYAVDSVASMVSVRGCLGAGLEPGNDCLIVGCDASHRKIPGLPSVTSVDVSWRQVGVAAVEQLLIASTNQGLFRTVLLKPQIVEGDSCPVPHNVKPEHRLTFSPTHRLNGIAV